MSRVSVLRAAFLLAVFSAALVLRSAFNYEFVFRPDGVNYQEGDAWFHMRTVHNLMHHFPRRSGFDPYTGFPTGQPVPTGPFFDFAIGTLAWVVGFGSPSQELIDLVGAWFPAVIGALTVVPVYWIGRTVFHPTAGLLAAVLIAVLPGYFFKASLLGFTDHHVAEFFLSSLVLLFLVLALTHARPVLYAALAGISLGCFLLTRPAGGFLVAVVSIFGVLQCFSNHARGSSSRFVAIVVLITLAIAWLIFQPVSRIIWGEYTLLALWSGIVGVSIAAGLSHVLRLRRSPVWLYFALLAAMTLPVLLILARFAPVMRSLVWNLWWRATAGPAQTVAELRPLLRLHGVLSLTPAWEEFTTIWFFALPTLLIIGRRGVAKNAPAWNLFTVWSIVMLAAALQQYRMSYYLAINFALLGGYCGWQLLSATTGKRRFLAGAAFAAVAICPNVGAALKLAETDTGPPAPWRAALSWLREHSPEPMGNATAFDDYYPHLTTATAFHYPPSAYGIMNWWDYGHWISAIGHRIPIANPMQTGATEAARFFTATDPRQANLILKETGARYIIADFGLPVSDADTVTHGGSKFWTMPIWVGKKPSDYFEIYLSTDGAGITKPIMVYYPAYYRTMLARLYLFDGQAVQHGLYSWVIEYGKQRSHDGEFRKIISTKLFYSYEEASAYIESRPGDPLVLAGMNPARSCVPIDKMEGVRLAYASPEDVGAGYNSGLIKIFEYSPHSD